MCFWRNPQSCTIDPSGQWALCNSSTSATVWRSVVDFPLTSVSIASLRSILRIGKFFSKVPFVEKPEPRLKILHIYGERFITNLHKVPAMRRVRCWLAPLKFEVGDVTISIIGCCSLGNCSNSSEEENCLPRTCRALRRTQMRHLGSFSYVDFAYRLRPISRDAYLFLVIEFADIKIGKAPV